MPHIALKMLGGRSDAQKQAATAQLTEALSKALGCPKQYISMSIQEFTPEEWQDVFREEITENPNVVITPQYDPKDLL